MEMDKRRRFTAMIVGSGGNGVGAAIELKNAGMDDFVIISKHADFGGVWVQNSYPGCALDDVIMGYQYDFAITGDWKSTHASHAEVAAYIQNVAAEHSLYEKAHFETELLSAEWDSEENAWSVVTNGGRYLVDFLLPVTGYLEEPIVAQIPGKESFEGRIFHSASWPDGYTGEGDRIAVVGTGSSALQIVPAMQKVAQQVIVFQRTPNHILPLNKRAYSEEEQAEWLTKPDKIAKERAELLAGRDEGWKAVVLTKGADLTVEIVKIAKDHLESQVSDPELREKLTPRHDFACKRPGASDDFYRALQERNVELVAEGAACIERNAIVSASGLRFEVDTIVLATGFLFGGSILHRIRRRDGRTIGEYQQGRPRAYKSVSVAQCPNLFLVGGAAPNGMTWRGVAAGTIVTGYAVKAINYMQRQGIRAMEVKESYEIDWKRKADEILAVSPMVAGGCINYSQDSEGYNKAAWPGSHANFAETMSEFDETAYDIVSAQEDVEKQD